MSGNSTDNLGGIERRTVVRAGAWTAPVIAVAAAAPAFASSTWRLGGTVGRTGDIYDANLTFQPGSPANPTLKLTFTLSGDTWRTGSTWNVLTAVGWTGARTNTVVTYTYGGTPMPPSTALFKTRRVSDLVTATLTIQLFVNNVASGDPVVRVN